jgi:5-deoxy-glucuronate isomerase
VIGVGEQVTGLTAMDAGWRFLDVGIWNLETGSRMPFSSPDHETAIVLVSGSIRVLGASLNRSLVRTSPFQGPCELIYLPPRLAVSVLAETSSTLAVGAAPAEGIFPEHVVEVSEMTSVLRGGGPARRQVISTLAPPVQAERLIVYEAYIPRGAWAGWPPHRHDGEDGSPYLEETYYYQFDRAAGFGFHRNYVPGLWQEHYAVSEGSLVPVRGGYHVCASAPPANMWVLNFLAGSSDDRVRPPVFDADETWIVDNWDRGQMALPAVNVDASAW